MKKVLKLTLSYPPSAEFERMSRVLIAGGGALLEADTKLYQSLYRAVEIALGYDTQANPLQYDHATFLVNFLYQHFIHAELSVVSIGLLHANILPPNTKGVFVYGEERKQQEVLRGAYRTIDTYLTDTEGREIDFLPHEQIAEALEEAVATFNNSPRKIHNIVHFFLSYNAIHPFMDGNGKVGRLLLEALLLANGYYPALMKKSYTKYMPDVVKMMNQYTLFPQHREEIAEAFIRFLLYRCYKVVYF